jgi:hypothetical protein
MRSGSQTRYKRYKMGHLPGDLPHQCKARLLEYREGKSLPEEDEWRVKGFKKDQHLRAEGAFRRSERAEIEEFLEEEEEQEELEENAS